jgi:hypothetical protein
MHHGKDMACHEDIGTTYFIITKSTILITIKPCKCSGSSLPWMEDVDNQFTLCKGPFQSILMNETHFHHDANVKEILNCCVLQKKH